MFFEKKSQTMCRLHLPKFIILKNQDLLFFYLETQF
jgi:hypothetical protein